MSDVEELRQDVINAVRDYFKALLTKHGQAIDIARQNMSDKLAALDEAEIPDPWQIIRETYHAMDRIRPALSMSLSDAILKIEAALAW
jgi:hypothetical protein